MYNFLSANLYHKVEDSDCGTSMPSQQAKLARIARIWSVWGTLGTFGGAAKVGRLAHECRGAVSF